MKNKILISVLLVAVMCVSIVLTACDNGAKTPHTHTYSTEWTRDETYHWLNPTCTDTTEVASKGFHKYENGICTVCQYAHENHDLEYRSISGEEHLGECSICGYSVTEQHVFVDGYCSACQFDGQHAHKWGEWMRMNGDMADELHCRACQECDEMQFVPHEFSDNGYVCNICGYVVSHQEELPPELQELAYVRKGNGYAVTGRGTFYQADLVIPEVYKGLPVIEISEGAFWLCSFIENIVIPDSVVTIGEYAFANCDVIENVVIPDSVVTIAEYAFANCDRIMNITFGTGIKTMEKGAFDGTRCGYINVKSIAAWCGITFGEYANPMYNGGWLLVDGNQVSEVVIPDGVTKISDRAFDRCYIAKVEIPVSVTSIGSNSLNFYREYVEIIYHGTMAQWNAIQKSDDWEPYNYKITCTDGTISADN